MGPTCNGRHAAEQTANLNESTNQSTNQLYCVPVSPTVNGTVVDGGGAWSAEQSQVAQESSIRGRVQILDGISSVQVAVDKLNKGLVACPEGICAVYSIRQGKYYLLWHAEKAAFAQQLMGQQVTAALVAAVAPNPQQSSRALRL